VSVKSILVDVSSPSDHVLPFAGELARRFGSELHGLYARRAWAAPLLPSIRDVLTTIDRGLSDSVERERSFLESCKAQGVAANWDERQGSRIALLGEASRFADIAVVQQQPELVPWGQNLDDVLERLVLASACPVLMVPLSGNTSARCERILIAWKNSREAARAARESIPFLKEARSVTILTVGPSQDNTAAQRISAFLTKHGVQAAAKHVENRDASTADSILEEAKALDCDLLVMGAYGHWRVQELVLGGVTQEILVDATLPVLFSH
jgi:nucleotide-binding universal stress UspA family protein